MPAPRKRKASFKFDVGFELEGPPELRPAIESATSEMVSLETRLPAAALDTLRNTGGQVAAMQRRLVNQIDSGLAIAGQTVELFGENVETAALGAMSQVGGLTDLLDAMATPAPPEQLVNTGNQAADVVGLVVSGGPADSFATDQPQGLEFTPGFAGAAAAAAQPFAAQGHWWVVLDCATMQFKAVASSDPDLHNPNYVWFTEQVDEASARQQVQNYSAQYGKNARCSFCLNAKKIAPDDPRCFPAQPKPPTQPTPPTPPTTPPTTPPRPPTAPPGTPGPPCPPVPSQDFDVYWDQLNCQAMVVKRGTTPPPPPWQLFAGGMTQAAAQQVASAIQYQLCTQPPQPPAPAPTGGQSPDPLCDPLGYCQSLVTGGSMGNLPTVPLPTPLQTILGITKPGASASAGIWARVFTLVKQSVSWVIGTAISWADQLLTGWRYPQCRNSAALVQAHTWLSVHDWASRILGSSFDRLKIPLTYTANQACPTLFPGVSNAIQAYLANTIPETTTRCWVEMNNHCWEPITAVIQSEARRLEISEALQLYRQGALSQTQFLAACRAKGVLDPALPDLLEAAARFTWGPMEVTKLWQRGLISQQERDRRFRRDGFLDPAEYDEAIELNTARLDPDRLTELHVRGLISDQDYEQAMQEIGWTRPGQIKQWKDLRQVIPPYSDLIRLMVRDAADTTIVKQFNLDVDFPQKFKGELADWAKQQGVSETIMRYMWRAHWQIPSPTQLAEFWRRFRHPGHPSGLQVSLQDIKDALSQQDILPFWQDYYLASQFNPLTRVDARRAYALGSITLDQVEASYREAGYSDENAAILRNFTEKDRLASLRRSPLVNKLAKLQITPLEFEQEMTWQAVPPQVIAELVQYALQKAEADTRSKCTANLATRFKVGDFTAADAVAELIRLGHDPAFAQVAVDGWVCALRTKSKQAQAAQLCRWYGIGLITALDFVKRLERLGWSTSDAVNLVSECQFKIDARRQKELEAQARADKAALEKAAAKAKRNADALARDQKNAAKAREAAKAAQDGRDKMLVKYSKVWADRIGADISDTFLRLKAARDKVTKDHALDPNQAIQAVVLAVEGWPTKADGDIESRIDEIGLSFENAPS